MLCTLMRGLHRQKEEAAYCHQVLEGFQAYMLLFSKTIDYKGFKLLMQEIRKTQFTVSFRLIHCTFIKLSLLCVDILYVILVKIIN
jgi:hypothetical protein